MALDLSLVFNQDIALLLQRSADAFSVPTAGMLSLVLFQASTLSPRAYTSSPDGGQLEPNILYLLNVGDSGINKTGLFKMNSWLTRKITTVVKNIAGDSDVLFEKGMSLPQVDIPVEDNSATTAAFILKHSQHRNIYRNSDEWGSVQRCFTNGGSGDTGSQRWLVLFNGEVKVTNELKSATETVFFPHFSCITNIQPKLFEQDLGKDSNLFGTGFTSRQLVTKLHSNLKTEEDRKPLDASEQGMFPLMLALAVRGLASVGAWTEKLDSAEIHASFIKGSEDDELSGAELTALALQTNRFTSDTFGDSATLAAENWTICHDLNDRNLHERNKATTNNRHVAGRFNVNHTPG